MTTTQQYVTRPSGQTETILEAPEGLPVVMGDFSYEDGVVKGRVAWTYDCRKVVVNHQVAETIQTKTPNRAAGLLAIVAGAFVGVMSGVLLSDADTFSEVEECFTDSEGYTTCSSPRDRAYGLGVLGILTSAAGVGAGLGTFALKPTSRTIDAEPAPPVVARVAESNVVCGSSPVQNLGLALVRAKERVAFSATNTKGEVAFAVPHDVSGHLMVIVHSVPPPIRAIHEGDIVGPVYVGPKQAGQHGSDTPKPEHGWTN